MAELNELYVFLPPRSSEYMLGCLCINFVFSSYVLTRDHEVHAVGISEGVVPSGTITLISVVDAGGFLALVCGCLLLCIE